MKVQKEQPHERFRARPIGERVEREVGGGCGVAGGKDANEDEFESGEDVAGARAAARNGSSGAKMRLTIRVRESGRRLAPDSAEEMARQKLRRAAVAESLTPGRTCSPPNYTLAATPTLYVEIRITPPPSA